MHFENNNFVFGIVDLRLTFSDTLISRRKQTVGNPRSIKCPFEQDIVVEREDDIGRLEKSSEIQVQLRNVFHFRCAFGENFADECLD